MTRMSTPKFSVVITASGANGGQVAGDFDIEDAIDAEDAKAKALKLAAAAGFADAKVTRVNQVIEG
jgi:hypothetical protein